MIRLTRNAMSIRRQGHLFFRPEIEDKNIVQQGANQLAELFVLRMNEILVAILLGPERQNVSMRATFVLPLRAVVEAPFVAGNLWNFLFEGAEGFFDFFN